MVERVLLFATGTLMEWLGMGRLVSEGLWTGQMVGKAVAAEGDWEVGEGIGSCGRGRWL